MRSSDFYKQLNEGRLLPVYLFLGEEVCFHQEMLNSAVAKLLVTEDQEFNFQKLSASSIAPDDLQRQIETPPFFGAVRVIYLAELEAGLPGTEEAILSALSSLATGVYLFISAMKLDGRKKLHQELQKRITTVDCSRINPRDLPAWISQQAKGMDLPLSSIQVNLLAQRLGNDLLLVRTELEKLKIFMGAGGRMSDQDFEALVPGEVEPDIFALINAVAERNLRDGLPRLEELLNSGENEIKLLATIARQFRNIVAAVEAREQGMNSQALADALGIKPFVAEKSFLQSGRFELAELDRILRRLLLADYRMKTGQQEPRLELELAVAEICGNLLP